MTNDAQTADQSPDLIAASQAQGPNLTQDSIPSLLAKLAIPAAIGFLFATLYNLVDTYWANQWSTDAADGFGVAGGPFFLMVAVAIGLNQGGTTMISNALGSGDKVAARASFFQSFILGAGASVILAVAGWLMTEPALNSLYGDRPALVDEAKSYLVPIYLFTFTFIFSFAMNSALAAQGDFATLGIVQIAAFCLNMFFDPALMHGWGPLPQLGVAGLAASTVTINFIGMAVILWRTMNSELMRGFQLSEFGINVPIMSDLIRQSLPAALNMVVISGGYIVIPYFLAEFGEGAAAGYSTGTRIEQLILLPVIGLQIAVLAIIGQNMGAGQFARVRQTFWSGIWISLAIMGGGTVLIWLTFDLFSNFFAGDAAVRRMSNLYLIYSSFALLSYGIMQISVGALQGMKRPLMPLFVNIVRLIIGPSLGMIVAIYVFDPANIHVAWSVYLLFAWLCALFIFFYALRQMKAVKALSSH